MVSRACSPMVFLSTDRSPAGAGGPLTSLCRVTPRRLAEVARVVLGCHQQACADPRREMSQAAVQACQLCSAYCRQLVAHQRLGWNVQHPHGF